MPLFNPPLPTPQALYDGELATTGSAVGAATTVYLVATRELLVPATLTNVRCGFATVGGTGHYDVGIYDATGANGAPNNLLAHAASTITALATATGNQTPALIGGNLALIPGRYWLALWIDNATDTIFRPGASAAGRAVTMSGTNAGPLPALASSITGLADGSFKPWIIGLLLGGFS